MAVGMGWLRFLQGNIWIAGLENAVYLKQAARRANKHCIADGRNMDEN